MTCRAIQAIVPIDILVNAIFGTPAINALCVLAVLSRETLILVCPITTVSHGTVSALIVFDELINIAFLRKHIGAWADVSTRARFALIPLYIIWCITIFALASHRVLRARTLKLIHAIAAMPFWTV